VITIELTPLSYRIKVTPKGQLLGTQLYLHNHLKRFSHTKWDHRLGRSILLRRYVHYDEKTQTLFLPRYDFVAFCQYLHTNNVPFEAIDLPLQQGADVAIPLKPHVKPRDQRQADAIQYLTTCPEAHRGLSVPPGFGKTVCTEITFAHFGKRAMVCVGGLVEQWQESIFEFTELTEADVYVIQGAASMAKLLLQIDKTIFPKIIICSLGTIRAYALGDEAYENYPPFIELFDRLRVGVKVIDEAHLNFYLTLMLDLQTNAAINIALTATFDRGEQQVKQIFDLHYPHLMRFGENEFDRYVDIYSYSYSLGGMIPSKAYRTASGYNHSKLEDYLLRRTPTRLAHIYDTIYSPAIFAHYVNVRKQGEKLLVLCATVDMCRWFQKKLMADLPSQEHFKIELYTYESDAVVLKEADVIISTPGSAGTGRDIKNLRTMLMTLATGSDNLNKQSLGRLRKLPDGSTPLYAYVWCRDFPEHVKYQEIRKNTYLARGKTYQEIAL
jgi:superfamily II DNA or RNA helicase